MTTPQINIPAAEQQRIQQATVAYADAVRSGDQAAMDAAFENYYNVLRETGVLDQITENLQDLGKTPAEIARMLPDMLRNITTSVANNNIAILQDYLNIDKDLLRGNIEAAMGAIDFGRTVVSWGKMLATVLGQENSSFFATLEGIEDDLRGLRDELRDELDADQRTVIDRSEADQIARDGQQITADSSSTMIEIANRLHLRLVSELDGLGSDGGAPAAATSMSKVMVSDIAGLITDTDVRNEFVRVMERVADNQGDDNAIDTAAEVALARRELENVEGLDNATKNSVTQRLDALEPVGP
tara:strand:+ start:327 stop:1226 length:900 start_codon:yes stop_codon:yes gene_type:complete